MSDERQSASLSDSSRAAEIDRDLAQLLSIVPSAEFVPRVQQRIREDVAWRRSRMQWGIRIAVAATVVLATLLGAREWWTQRGFRETSTARITNQPSSVIVPTHRAVPVPQPLRVARRRPRRAPAVTAGATDAGTKQAEVLVSRDQLRAIARLQQLIATGDLTDKNSPPVDSVPEAVADIRPAPLTIAPLTVSAVETVTGGEGFKARLER